MIKAKGVINGRETLILGLSHGNLHKFLNDKDTYIPIRAEEIDIPFDIMIVAGETEQAMAEKLRGGITPDTKVHITDRLKQEGFKP